MILYLGGQKSANTSKFVKIAWLFLLITLKSKNFREQKVHPRMSIQEENLKSIFGLKKAYFFRQLCPRRLESFKKYFLFTKYYDPDKISLLTLLGGEVNGGGGLPPLWVLSFGKRPGSLRVKEGRNWNLILYHFIW